MHFNRALALNRNDADVAAAFANILVYWGRWREALEWMEVAERPNPFPPDVYHSYHALALYSAHQYEHATRILKGIRTLGRWGHGLLAACYAQTNLDDEARAEAEKFVSEGERKLLERGSSFPQTSLDLALVRASRYRNAADREHFLGGLRKAGLA